MATNYFSYIFSITHLWSSYCGLSLGMALWPSGYQYAYCLWLLVLTVDGIQQKGGGK
jgi:hypothetical protein